MNCELCKNNTIIDYKDYSETHHKDRDVNNNHSDNLMSLCFFCHQIGIHGNNFENYNISWIYAKLNFIRKFNNKNKLRLSSSVYQEIMNNPDIKPGATKFLKNNIYKWLIEFAKVNTQYRLDTRSPKYISQQNKKRIKKTMDYDNPSG